MNIMTLIENLRQTIQGKEDLLKAWKQRPAEDWESTGVTYEVMSKMVQINIDELTRILQDALACRAEDIVKNVELAKLQKGDQIRGWTENPDRMGGQFTQDEINNADKWN